MSEQRDEKSLEGLKGLDTRGIGLILAGGGALGSFYLLIRRNRNILAWIIPVGLIVAGVDLLLKERQERIEQTGDLIMAQLDELDPITRAKVIKYMADKEIEKISK